MQPKSFLIPGVTLAVISFLLISSCFDEFPKSPNYVILQPVFGLVCNDQGSCIAEEYCNVYRRKKNDWVLDREEPLAFCDGILGVSAEDFEKLKSYERDLKNHIKKKCVVQ